MVDQTEFEVQYGIIGGTGLDAWGEDENKEGINLPSEFQWGPPSAPPQIQSIDGTRCISLLRHGKNHTFSPHEVPYGANIGALKECGVTDLVGFCAAGSLRDHIKVGDFILVTQYIDRTKGTRSKTYFEGNGVVAHVSLADPTCQRLSQLIMEAAKEVPGLVMHDSGTLVCIEGPQFSTRAESQAYRLMGGDLVGMTTYTEACFAREAQLCYANIAMVVDHDCYNPLKPHVEKEMPAIAMKAIAHKATELQAAIGRKLRGEKRPNCECGCNTSLDGASLTHGLQGSNKDHKKYDLLGANYF